MLSKLDSSVHMVNIEFLVYLKYSPIYNGGINLKLNNPKQSYAHLTFGVLKSLKWRNQLFKVRDLFIGSIAN